MNQKELMKIIKTDAISFEQFNDQADARTNDIDVSLICEIEKKKLGFIQLNDNIPLKPLYRDKTLEIMDRYLTNGGRVFKYT